MTNVNFTDKELKAIDRILKTINENPLPDDQPGGVGVLVEKNAENTPNNTALIFEDQRLSYDEFNRLSNRFANHFLKMGAVKGQRCAVFLSPSMDYLVAITGLAKIGVVSCLINNNLQKKSLAHAINIASPDYLVVHSVFADVIKEIEDDIDCDTDLIWVWNNKESIDRETYHNLTAALTQASTENPPTTMNTQMGDLVSYIYTSGTTGFPKAVRVVAKTWIKTGYFAIAAAELESEDVCYAPVTLYHGLSMVSWATALVLGATFVFSSRFSASRLMATVRKHGVTILMYIGEFPRYLLNQPEKDNDRDNPLRKMIGMGMKADLWQKIMDRFGIEQIIELYSATEGSGAIFNLDGKPGMLGRIYQPELQALVKFDSDTDSFLRDESGHFIRCTQPGEGGVFIALLNDDNRFEGYTDENASEKKKLRDVFTEGDCWYNSGDLMKLNADGWISFQDRLGDTFRWKSENVSTQEVESILLDFPVVELAAVYGVQVGEMEGQAGMASIVPRKELEWDWNAFASFTGENLPPYAIPRFIRLRSELLMTHTHKVRKVELKNEGFDPSSIDDPLYFWNTEDNQYLPLTTEVFEKILSSDVRL